MPRRRSDDDVGDLDLIPIMNMVLILIPLLLLSVVFVEISIIRIQMAQQAQGMPQDQPDEPPKRLQVWISKDGFAIYKNGEPVPPIAECAGQTSGMTICLANGSAENDIDRYRWVELYNTLLDIKKNGGFIEHENLELVAGSDITFDIIVKAMDFSRHMRSPDEGASDGVPMQLDAFKASWVVRNEEGQPKDLFPHVILGMPSNTRPGG